MRLCGAATHGACSAWLGFVLLADVAVASRVHVGGFASTPAELVPAELPRRDRDAIAGDFDAISSLVHAGDFDAVARTADWVRDGHALEAWALIGTGLSHADPSIRERAVAALGRAAAALAGECAHLTSECVAALSGPALDDEDELVRERTVEVLGRLAAQFAGTPLDTTWRCASALAGRALLDASAQVRRRAVRVLGAVARHARRQQPSVAALVVAALADRALSDESFAVRHEIATTLGDVVDHGIGGGKDELAKPVAAALASQAFGDYSMTIRRLAARTLGSVGRAAPDAALTLAVRTAAVLSEKGVANKSLAYVRAAAEHVVAGNGAAAPGPDLVAFLAAEALGHGPVIIRTTAVEAVRSLAASAGGESERRRLHARRSRHFGKMDDSSRGLVVEVVGSMGGGGAQSHPAAIASVALLLQVLGDDSRVVRRKAAGALGAVAAGVARRWPDLAERCAAGLLEQGLAKEKDGPTRDAIVGALGDLAAEAAAAGQGRLAVTIAVSLTEMALRDDRVNVRRRATQALSGVPAEAALESRDLTLRWALALLRQGLLSPDDGARALAVTLLGRLAPGAAEERGAELAATIGRALARALDDRSASVARSAAEALGDVAESVMSERGGLAARCVSALLDKGLRKEKHIRAVVVEVLGRVAVSAGCRQSGLARKIGVELGEKALADKSAIVRSKAPKALGAVAACAMRDAGGLAGRCVAALMERGLTHERDCNIRALVVETLGGLAIRAMNERSRFVTRIDDGLADEALADPSAIVRSRAVEALGAIAVVAMQSQHGHVADRSVSALLERSLERERAGHVRVLAVEILAKVAVSAGEESRLAAKIADALAARASHDDSAGVRAAAHAGLGRVAVGALRGRRGGGLAAVCVAAMLQALVSDEATAAVRERLTETLGEVAAAARHAHSPVAMSIVVALTEVALRRGPVARRRT